MKRIGIKRSGFSLIEMIIYLAILAMSLALIVNSIILLSSSNGRLANRKVLNNSAISALERITRDIQRSVSVDVINSVLNTDPGVLSLTITESSGATATTKFYLDGDALTVDKNGDIQGALTQSGVRATSLIFNDITSADTTGIRTTLTLSVGGGKEEKTETFYATTLLRGSL